MLEGGKTLIAMYNFFLSKGKKTLYMKYTLITNIYNVAERMLHLLKQTWLESTQEKTTRVVNNIGTSLKAHTFCRKEMVTLKQKILSILFDSSMCI